MDMFSKIINELNGKPTHNPLEMIINSAIDSAEGPEIEWDELSRLLDEADKDIIDYLEAQLIKRGYSMIGP